MAIPTALLRRFYVGQSLRNKDDGFEFKLANRIAPTTILSLGPIEVDGEVFAPNQVVVRNNKSRPANAIRENAPLFLNMGNVVSIAIPGRRLSAGKHRVIVHALTKEVGPVSIEFDETIL